MENITRITDRISRADTYNFFFEKQFSLVESAKWMEKYWTVSIVLVVVYLILVYAGVEFMKGRPRYDLRGPLFAWNTTLTLLYVVSILRLLPHVLNHLFQNGFHNFVCTSDCPVDSNCGRVFWGWLFVILKAPELLDTAFVVLRKQPLFFLHLWHHSTVLVFTWYLYGHVSSVGSVFASVNSLVHTLMYFYYSLKSLSVRIPRPISMALTLIQISQMALGCYVNYYVYQVKRLGRPCSVYYSDIVSAYLIYVSYFVLFLWYFYKAYIARDALIIAKMKGQKIE